LALEDRWRRWRISPSGARPGTLALRSVFGASFPHSPAGMRSGRLTRLDALGAAGFCFASPLSCLKF
jgi:hypothetical protein